MCTVPFCVWKVCVNPCIHAAIDARVLEHAMTRENPSSVRCGVAFMWVAPYTGRLNRAGAAYTAIGSNFGGFTLITRVLLGLVRSSSEVISSPSAKE